MSEKFDQLVALAGENTRLREEITRLRKIVAEIALKLDKQEAEKLLKEALVFGGDLGL
jgi:regulator of replication initiation timing